MTLPLLPNRFPLFTLENNVTVLYFFFRLKKKKIWLHICVAEFQLHTLSPYLYIHITFVFKEKIIEDKEFTSFDWELGPTNLRSKTVHAEPSSTSAIKSHS